MPRQSMIDWWYCCRCNFCSINELYRNCQNCGHSQCPYCRLYSRDFGSHPSDPATNNNIAGDESSANIRPRAHFRTTTPLDTDATKSEIPPEDDALPVPDVGADQLSDLESIFNDIVYEATPGPKERQPLQPYETRRVSRSRHMGMYSTVQRGFSGNIPIEVGMAVARVIARLIIAEPVIERYGNADIIRERLSRVQSREILDSLLKDCATELRHCTASERFDCDEVVAKLLDWCAPDIRGHLEILMLLEDKSLRYYSESWMVIIRYISRERQRQRLGSSSTEQSPQLVSFANIWLSFRATGAWKRALYGILDFVDAPPEIRDGIETSYYSAEQPLMRSLFYLRARELSEPYMNQEEVRVGLPQRYNWGRILAELRLAVPHTFSAERTASTGCINLCQGAMETWARAKWDWWPMRPYLRKIAGDELRVSMELDCGHKAWMELPTEFATELQEWARKFQPEAAVARGHTQ
ncbi:hypothetical protein BJX61DRAFT_41671 [Aspergillus egyptiacus]|nr:hypothetical protein BJX61DRAFT_41671 [Aspergillus egyptiacus]